MERRIKRVFCSERTHFSLIVEFLNVTLMNDNTKRQDCTDHRSAEIYYGQRRVGPCTDAEEEVLHMGERYFDVIW